MRKIAGFLLSVLVLSSCTVYKEYPIDIYKPGEAYLPPDAKNIALVYRNFKYENDTLQHYFKDNRMLQKAKNDPVKLDSTLAAICLNELALNLKNENKERKISIYTDFFKPHKAAKMPVLNTSVVNNLVETMDADFVIMLETYSYFYTEYEGEQGIPKPREVITANVWSAYNPVLQKITDRKTLIDTVFWNALDEAGNIDKKSKLPPRLSALKIASQLAGENYAKRYLAAWVNTKRSYSIPPLPDFEMAEKYIQKGDWDNAILLWKRYADDKNGKLSINARYNLAFGYEMKDDIDSAIQWITAAKQSAESYKNRSDLKLIEQYNKVLIQRKKEVERLNQM
jgi:hypothetical protein